MNRKDFFRTLFGGAALAAAATNISHSEIQVNPEQFDNSIPTIGINEFDSVLIHAHSYETITNGWIETVATGEKTFSFEGVSRFHLADISEARSSMRPVRLRLSWDGKTVVVTGKVKDFSVTSTKLDFSFFVGVNDECRLS